MSPRQASGSPRRASPRQRINFPGATSSRINRASSSTPVSTPRAMLMTRQSSLSLVCVCARPRAMNAAATSSMCRKSRVSVPLPSSQMVSSAPAHCRYNSQTRRRRCAGPKIEKRRHSTMCKPKHSAYSRASCSHIVL